MLQANNQTSAMLFKTDEQVFNLIVPAGHHFRKLKLLIDWNELAAPLRKLYGSEGNAGYPVEKTFPALMLQYWEDLSDRELESALKENLAIRWFCGFSITEQTPDFSYFSKLRKRIGAKQLANLFNKVNGILREYGMFGDVFTFIDASAIISKNTLWEERDQALEDGLASLNNAVVSKYAADDQAKWGAKGKNKVWFGYKKHQAVDMRHGMISKVAVTPANVLDYKATNNIVPKSGMVFSDKLYDCRENNNALKAAGVHNGVIKKRNNKLKNKDLDKWVSRMRMPFESTFAHQSKRTRYRGQAKVYFQVLAESLCHNLKKALKVLSVPMPAAA
jgi:transposase, IS5 family